MERVEVRPKLWRLGAIVVGALGFSAAGVAMIIYGGLFEFVIGLVAVFFFGGGMVLTMLALARRRFVTLTLTPIGIEANGGLAPWEDIEAVGVMKQPTKLFGIRLTSYDRYLASMSSTDRGMAERHMRWFFRPIAAVTGLIGGAGLLGYARNVSSLEQSLRWNRTTSGWDLTFSPLMLDRRLPAFVTFVEEYRRGVQDDPELDSSAEA